MAIKLFGYSIGRTTEEQEREAERIPSFTPAAKEDGAIEVSGGGAYGTYVDLEGTAKTEAELCTRYREMAHQAEAYIAVDDIVNESIVRDDERPTVAIELEKTGLSASIQKTIRGEFDNVLNLLDFNGEAYDIFRKWYVDGRLYYHMMIDVKSPRDGIKELRYVDPRKIRKVREPKRKRKDQLTGLDLNVVYNEYFLYSPKGLTNTNQGIKIAADSICHVTSGIMDQRSKLVLGHLHKAIKPLNQLRMLEDATVIYRLARAPERRIFYIDVGNLPKMKAEQYLRDMMVKHKNKLVYDAATGEVRDDRKFMTMLEDFWLPRREGGRGTEITTLPGGQNLGEMDDVEYFKKKLYKSLNVPVSRMEAETAFNMGRASEITRDEVKFSKFVTRLRLQFSHLFNKLLETQLILKGVVNRDEWKDIQQNVFYKFLEDNHFSELKQSELIENRLRLVGEIDQYVGKYFSENYIRTNILRMTEKEINQIEAEVEQEAKINDQQAQEDQPPQEMEQEEYVVPFIPPHEDTSEQRKLVEILKRSGRAVKKVNDSS